MHCALGASSLGTVRGTTRSPGGGWARPGPRLVVVAAKAAATVVTVATALGERAPYGAGQGLRWEARWSVPFCIIRINTIAVDLIDASSLARESE